METFKTADGRVIQPEFIDAYWRLVLVNPDGTKKVGKSRFSLRADALNELRKNSVLVP